MTAVQYLDAVGVFVAVVVGLLGVFSNESYADEGLNRHGQRTLSLVDLPEPPAELKPLLAKGKITFLVGGERPSVVNPSRSTGVGGRKFDAETQFRLSYSFKTRCRWGWDGPPASQRLAIQVGYDRLRLDVSHQVWLLRMPEPESFWDAPLVRHEFDHVRLSCDPRLTAQFVKAVNTHRRIVLTREESEPLIRAAQRRMPSSWLGSGSPLKYFSGADAQPWLEEIVNAEFQRIVDLVGIRYQELDRQTNHGRLAVPESGELSEWLRY
ncbi:hypothetical protein [Aporhodopirellula aestuarii]|uniref:Secreted protein n=1 Tax=Aporhodopirellula aestuarii TaxID=2950107 RepID=A0ABT0TYF6_9BACT|nr:hypothetical protein [Aporhodopirellula aestuarii]MCM2369293.1 hypothetical protein [Aporhodopirellula aestuarii]